ncbi:hypothetical protein FFK22_025200 [Mycobacterium sp. KBS0706]|uniref:hypothetical protein n=1 Tax=Mycobacterium sp. KBS0706 TaxID=2578109 RepID=UPI00110F9500|nr:hypothetical protein [Mycobacterium sp. KBS0706]TSD85894.1 hypothetical protein FFK22_025200 [Mycobacterium sp. KBS0706]
MQIISYTPIKEGQESLRHIPPLRELFGDIINFTSHDTPAATIVPDVDRVESLPSSRELRMLDDDDLRKKLSGFAKKILEETSSNTSDPSYMSFLSTYSSNVHQAWHITPDEPQNIFYGYRVVGKVHGSPFSTIWELSDNEGRKLALKILLIENLKSGP